MLFYSSSCQVFERVIHSLSFHYDTTTVLDVSIMYICVRTRGDRVLRMRRYQSAPKVPCIFVCCTLLYGEHSESEREEGIVKRNHKVELLFVFDYL